MPVATTARPTSTHHPEAVLVHLGGRWIAGQVLSRRGSEVLVSHHGHLVWVDQQFIRTP